MSIPCFESDMGTISEITIQHCWCWAPALLSPGLLNLVLTPLGLGWRMRGISGSCKCGQQYWHSFIRLCGWFSTAPELGFWESSSKEPGPAPPTTHCLLLVQSQYWGEWEISWVPCPHHKMVMGDSEQCFPNCRSKHICGSWNQFWDYYQHLTVKYSRTENNGIHDVQKG